MVTQRTAPAPQVAGRTGRYPRTTDGLDPCYAAASRKTRRLIQFRLTRGRILVRRISGLSTVLAAKSHMLSEDRPSIEPVEPISFPSVPPWAEAFPRLSEIYTVSNRASPRNWFQQSNVWRSLLDNSTGLQPLEEELQMLDAASWAVFRVKAARLVHVMDKWGYSRALFDCFNEIRGYRYLVQEGYEEVQFVPEQQDMQTPDLRARSRASAVVMEIKTVNESTKQKNYFEIPGDQRIALDVEYQVSDALKKKLTATIARARRQLLAAQDSSVVRRIIYIVIRPDFHIEAEGDLATFLEGQSTPGIEVLHCLLS